MLISLFSLGEYSVNSATTKGKVPPSVIPSHSIPHCTLSPRSALRALDLTLEVCTQVKT